MKQSIWTLGLVAALAVGCKSSSVPPARVASTEAAVKSAREAGADRVPDAQARLKAAEDQLVMAKRLIDKGETGEVEGLLTRAESDAALAAALSYEAQQKAATEAEKQPVRAKQPPGKR